MLKLIIVDDEYLIRQLIRASIDWNKFEIEIVGEFSSAASAMQFMEAGAPDIVLTDICMPRVDGLAFAEEIKNRYPNTHIVAITGHDNFNYAKRGIEIGLDGYILKPIDNDELHEQFVKLCGKIRKERERDTEWQGLSEYKKETQSIIKDYYVHKLLTSDWSYNRIGERFVHDLFRRDVKNVNVCVFDYVIGSAKYESQERMRRRKEFLLIQLKESFPEAVLTEDELERVILLASDENADEAGNNKNVPGHGSANDSILSETETYEVRLALIRKTWKKEYGYPLFYGEGRIENGNNSIHTAYIQAQSRLNFAIINSNEGTVKKEDRIALKKAENEPFMKVDEMRELQYCMETESLAKMTEMIDGVFSRWQNISENELEYLKVQLLNTIFHMSILLKRTQKEDDLQETFYAYYEQIRSMKKLADLKRVFREICLQIAKADNEHETENIAEKTADTSKLIFGIRQYIRDHLDDPELSLVTIANEYYLNSSYLSRIFKKETGTSFIQYLNDQRMEKAKNLLQFSSLKIYEIGEHVGIDNANYFGILFKKKTGLTPVDFRKKYQGDEA